ncbi:hypothetical protein [Nostoc sp. CMAA1605]|uniref:hypothetical protein n=1 Tax=Nostoc sp. CMAA1605 TaxID=2055159 RepID=UPI001F37F262|nr:hypothetical protein [Nostoc sp. CMAA1605]MCF4965757.1 hypothetical protein [Nostoc sp. CMAA1605]
MTISDAQWEIAHAIALTLVKDNTDVNEVGKAVAYLRGYIHQPDATSRFFKYLKTLVSNGRQIGHSGKTTDYYRSIDKACSDYLKSISDAHTILQILGWVSRLMRYYKDAGVPIGEMSASKLPPVNSTHPALNSQNSNNYNFTVGQIVDAKVVNFDKQELQDGKKTKQRIIITYEIQGSDCPSKEEVNKQDINLSLGDIVKVKIEKVQGANIRKVKRVV